MFFNLVSHIKGRT